MYILANSVSEVIKEYHHGLLLLLEAVMID